jgi:hypothetical protein
MTCQSMLFQIHLFQFITTISIKTMDARSDLVVTTNVAANFEQPTTVHSTAHPLLIGPALGVMEQCFFF